MFGALVFMMIVVVCALAFAGFSLFLLPFRILGGLFKLGAALIAVPIMLVMVILAASFLGLGALLLMLPFLLVLAIPIALIAWMLGWGRRGPRPERIVT